MEREHAVRSYLVFFLLVVIVVAVIPTHGRAATAIVTVTATVLRNLSVRATSELAFGSFDTSASAGTIVLGNDGSRVATGGTQLDHGATAGPAVLEIQGEPHAGFSLSMPAETRISNATGASMVVDDFRQSSKELVSLDSHGQSTVRIGATLHVQPNQPLGAYAGMMQVTVNYN